MNNFTCGICGKQYDNLNAYMECVAKCGETMLAAQKAEEERERLAKLNADLNKVKAAKAYFEEIAAKFKEDYPEEYELNFGKDKCECECSKAKDIQSDIKTESIEVSFEDDGKGKPKMVAKVNGKEVEDDIINELMNDPDMKYITRLLRIL